MKKLLYFRRAFAVIVLALFVLIFARFESFGRGQLADKLLAAQFFPALFSSPVFWITVLTVILVTLLAGRLYCSFLCPFGLIQDFLARISFRDKKNGLPRQKEFFKLHTIVALIIIFTAFAGFMTFLNLTEPFAVSGRIFTNLVQPATTRLSLWIAEFQSSVSWLNKVRANPTGPANFLAAVALTLILLLIVRKWGRIYCNTICPVGAILRLTSNFSLFKLEINQNDCISCQLCRKNCKAGCIDIDTGQLDFSRCVMCLNCVGICPTDAIKTSFVSERIKRTDKNFSPQRRAVITGAALGAAAYLAPYIPVPRAEAEPVILPPGASDMQRFSSKCISCHLCVSSCPSAIIVGTSSVYSSLVKPQLNYTNGMCEQTCNICTEICPTGALKPVSLKEKETLKIAQVEYDKDLCVVKTDKKDCGACAEHCPTKAVRMVPYEQGLKIPEVDPAICVGCGGCEHICPVRPIRAVVVKPILKQKHIELPESEPLKPEESEEEFPF
ncbi:MAG: 4Fe-4S binding protein [Candidatus Rifleibacteriota bacterium]